MKLQNFIQVLIISLIILILFKIIYDYYKYPLESFSHINNLSEPFTNYDDSGDYNEDYDNMNGDDNSDDNVGDNSDNNGVGDIYDNLNTDGDISTTTDLEPVTEYCDDNNSDDESEQNINDTLFKHPDTNYDFNKYNKLNNNDKNAYQPYNITSENNSRYTDSVPTIKDYRNSMKKPGANPDEYKKYEGVNGKNPLNNTMANVNNNNKILNDEALKMLKDFLTKPETSSNLKNLLCTDKKIMSEESKMQDDGEPEEEIKPPPMFIETKKPNRNKDYYAYNLRLMNNKNDSKCKNINKTNKMMTVNKSFIPRSEMEKCPHKDFSTTYQKQQHFADTVRNRNLQDFTNMTYGVNNCYDIPQIKPPPCIPQNKQNVCPLQLYRAYEGTPLEMARDTSVGSIMPKFTYKEVYDKEFY
jgi:hypothetical protein